MYLFIDILFIIIIFILIISVLCGFLSLCERKFNAILHLRIGPSLFCFGLLTPITDGLKLMFKYFLVVMSIDVISLFATYFIILFCSFGL